MMADGKTVLASWLGLTYQERVMIAMVLGIALVGLAARYLHLKGERPVPYDPGSPAAVDQKGLTP